MNFLTVSWKMIQAIFSPKINYELVRNKMLMGEMLPVELLLTHQQPGSGCFKALVSWYNGGDSLDNHDVLMINALENIVTFVYYEPTKSANVFFDDTLTPDQAFEIVCIGLKNFDSLGKKIYRLERFIVPRSLNTTEFTINLISKSKTFKESKAENKPVVDALVGFVLEPGYPQARKKFD